MSQYPDRQSTQVRAPQPAAAPAPGGVDLSTLALTAAASAFAAYVTSKVWAPGTLASAAFTPVIVALVKEGLRKPAEVVARTVPAGAVPRRQRRYASPEDETQRYVDDLPPLPEAPGPEATEGPITYHRVGQTPARRHWRTALIAGVLGFVVSAAAYTLPELVAGKAASGGGRSTTLFGGHRNKSSTPKTTTVTSTTETQTVQTVPQQTVTVPPPVTVTVPPETQPAPAPRAKTTPTQTTPPATVPPTTTPTTPAEPVP